MKRLAKEKKYMITIHVRLISKPHSVMTPKKGKGSYKRRKFKEAE